MTADPDLRSQMAESARTLEPLLARLAAGDIAEDDYRTQAMKHGILIGEREVWVLDLLKGRWLYYDGVQLRDLDAEAGSPADG